MKGLIQAIGAPAVLAEAGLTEAPSPPRPIASPNVGFSQGGFGLGVVFGVLTPDKLRAAADLATHYGDGRIGLAPGRAILLHGVASSAAPRLTAAASAAAFVVDPQDLRLRLDACIGRAGCANASEDVRADALRLASAAPATGLHVSGCVKGCAHPGVAGVTLVSRAEPGRYDVILNGAPSSPAAWADVSLNEISDRLARPTP
jgi:precorrin-3B synthase